MSLDTRSQFIAVLANLPLLRADAAVVLCGQDATPRIQVGIEIMQQEGAGKLVLSGALHKPPEILGAQSLVADVYGAGVAPSRVLLEKKSTNTREQAVEIVKLAEKNEWQRLLLIASPYHTYRAFLTFLMRLIELELNDEIQIVPVGAAQSSWFKEPSGSDTTRLDLLNLEFEKIDEYTDHVAPYSSALRYLKSWDARQWDKDR